MTDDRQQRLAKIAKEIRRPPGAEEGLRFLKISDEVTPVGWNPMKEINAFIELTRRQRDTIEWLLAEVERWRRQ